MNFSDIKQAAHNRLPNNFDRDAVLEALNLPSHKTDALPLWAAFGAGVIAGLAAGMLFAPQSGQESRQQIEKKSRQAQRAAKKNAQNLQEELS